MKKEIIKYANKAGLAIAKQSPLILTITAVGGIVTTAILTHRAAIKAHDLILAENEERLEHEFPVVQGVKEYATLTWKFYIPPVVTCAMSIACIIGANSIHKQRYAALASLYAVSETALKEYKEKVAETIGKGKAEKIDQLMLQDKIDRHSVVNNEVIETGHGKTLCFDAWSGRYFRSDIEHLRRVENELNRELLIEAWVSLNTVYYELGLEDTKFGELMGWHSELSLIDFQFETKMAHEKEPCLVLDFSVAPKYGERY